MNKELSTLDQYLTDPSWGKSNIKETINRKIRRNLLTDEELSCDQDDLGNFVSIWDHVYLIHLSRKSKKPEYIYVIEDVSMLEPATQRSKKLFLDALQLVANKYEKSIDEAIVALTDAASITADDSKWTKRDLGILKRGVNWLEDQYRDETKEK